MKNIWFKLITVSCAFTSLIIATKASAQLSHEALTQSWQSLMAEAWVVKESSFPYQQCFELASMKTGLPLSLLLAVARGESSFDKSAISKSNAIGIMQIKWPITAKHLGIQNKSDLFDPCTNIDAGARYIVELKKRYSDDMHLTLAAYNYGPGRINQDGKNVPRGALWYSEYVLDHHDVVMKQADLMGEDGEIQTPINVIYFAQPYRAKAMKSQLEKMYSQFKFDWFKKEDGEFVVRVVTLSKYEKIMAERQLRYLGLI
jgi:hypothetical protein